MDVDELKMLAETTVEAKRLGWDESLSPEQELDLDPFDHEETDLRGRLSIVEVPETAEVPAFLAVLVGGQEADPNTVRAAGSAEVGDNSFCPSGPGGGVDPSCSPGLSTKAEHRLRLIQAGGDEKVLLRGLSAGERSIIKDHLARPREERSASPAARSPVLVGHPLGHLSADEIRAELSGHLSGHRSGDAQDAWHRQLDQVNVSGKDKMILEVEHFVRGEKARNPLADVPFPTLFGRLRENRPGLTAAQFQRIVRDGARQGRFSLEPFTGAAYQMEHPELILPAAGELKGYARAKS